MNTKQNLETYLRMLFYLFTFEFSKSCTVCNSIKRVWSHPLVFIRIKKKTERIYSRTNLSLLF